MLKMKLTKNDMTITISGLPSFCDTLLNPNNK